jgi:hypothetical protein
MPLGPCILTNSLITSNKNKNKSKIIILEKKEARQQKLSFFFLALSHDKRTKLQ